MRYFSEEDLARVLELHEMWIRSVGADGKRADLRDADLRNVCLAGVNLSGADLRGMALALTGRRRKASA